MKIYLTNLWGGYFSVLKYIFTGRNDGKFLRADFNLPLMLMVLVIIGFIRNLLHIIVANAWLPNKYVWYSMDPDIVFTMTVFPLYLCFFGALILSLFLKIFIRQRHDKEILSFCFYLQLLHLLVPLFDILNVKFNIPYVFQIFPSTVLQLYISNLLVVSMGIMMVWLLSGIAVVRFLKETFRATFLKIFLTGFLAFNFLFWPIYIAYPIFNYFFNNLFWADGTGHLFMMGAHDLFYGYAIFFLFLSLAGIIYFRKLFFKINKPHQLKS